MCLRNYTILIILSLFISLFAQAQKSIFPIVTKPTVVSIVYDKTSAKLDSITAYLLADDIERVTSIKPRVVTDVSEIKGEIIVIGRAGSSLIQKIARQSSLLNKLKGKWECFALTIVDRPLPGITKALVIAGSDARGTAYGVFTVSEKIGVSPWYWWADVPVRKQEELIITQPDLVSSPPAVKYRGIFINDEDWGLRPWAASTFEPEVGNIGPKTYAKVFELLLRLKANFIWPAMHPGTSAFYSVPGNKEVAALYSIVIGSSHAEPMLRNNVGEWNEKTMGAFNYLTNKEKVYEYWEERVKESSGNEVVYTMGMRGVHDSQMEGVKTAKEAVPLLEQIITDQRALIKKYNSKNITSIPQVFTLYKEVLEFYDNGLKIPNDITLVWPDDNYGYIQRLSDEQEKKRPGGAGVYYHISYWGRPHDYLWLSTTHPALIREEIMKAYETGANRLWVLNVGDIKPGEYDLQFFLDMAYNPSPFKVSDYAKRHLLQWNEKVFGINATAITNVLWKYYDLAFERKPEFMGWSQTEPTTNTNYTAYNHFNYGDEAQQRIDNYNALENTVNDLRKKVGPSLEDAFYELVYYPVVGAAEMNKKILYHDKAYIYGKQNRISAYNYASMSDAAYHRIEQETGYYNTSLQNGKWKNMMSMKPRDLPVFHSLVLPPMAISKEKRWGIAPEGSDTTAIQDLILPSFTEGMKQAYFIDLFLSDSTEVLWNARPSADWISISSQSGTLLPGQDKNQVRLWVTIDWEKAPSAEHCDGEIIFGGSGKQYVVKVQAFHPKTSELKNYKGFVENNGYVSMYAQHFTGIINKPGLPWEMIKGLGHTGASMMTSVSSIPAYRLDTATTNTAASHLTYDFLTFNDAAPVLVAYALPTQPLNKSYGVRCAFSIDNGPLQIVDFKSNSIARTKEWKENVLSNEAIRHLNFTQLKAGKHTLTVYAVDPGVILDRLLIDLGGLKSAYGVIAETR